MNTVGQIAQGYAVAKQAWVDIDTILPLKQTLRELATAYNLHPVEWADSEDIKEAKDKLFSDLQSMMQQPQWMEQPQWEQPLQPNPMQPWVM